MSSKSLFAFNIKAFKICANVHLGEEMGILPKLYTGISLIVTFLFEISLIMDLLINGLTDFNVLCEAIPMVMAFFMVSYEFYNIVAQKKNIESLLVHIQDTNETYRPKFASGMYKKSVMGVIVDKIDKFGLMNILFGCMCVILWIIRPLVTNSKVLPFGNSWLPFDTAPFYYYLCAIQGFAAMAGAINTINIHLFYGKIMAVLCEQFNSLNHFFQCIDEELDRIDTKYAEKVMYNRVQSCIVYHHKILECCDKLQTCISGVLVCQYCFGMSLCFAALASFSMNAFSGAFFNLMNHILLELSELYIFCWFSNKLTDYAVNVTDGVFYSRWYDRSPRIKRLMRFVMMRCQKPVIIKAGNLVPASIHSFIWILQQSYSYFMVLRTVRTK